jgi:DNA-directed RNA polymerase specialized sigma subunit
VSRALEIAETLPAQQKIVILECTVKERPQTEVADMLGVSPSRICQLLAKAERSLARKPESNDAKRECA